MNAVYGYELILDLHGCEPDTFNRDSINKFFSGLCERIGMERCEVHFWDDVGVPIEEQQTEAHTKGTSAVCFILTSTIVVHTLELLKAAYINIFSCRYFDPEEAAEYTKEWFRASSRETTFLARK